MYSDRVISDKRMQRVFCLLLCVGAWRGPVPMLHDHQAMTNPGVRERHEQVFHGSSCEECGGLHWHFAFPEDGNGPPLPISDEVAPELAVFACAAASQSMESRDPGTTVELLAFADEALPRAACADGLRKDQLKFRPKSFLASLLCDVRLTAITGVCLL
jgi:hypothetical protein